jgi:hypothetical protein
MGTEVKPKKIRARLGLTKLSDGDLGHLLVNSLNGLTTNAAIFSKLPVDPVIYKDTINDFLAAVPVALDGSKTAIVRKNKLRERAIRIYEELAHYVEANCNDDMETFLLSGFLPTAKAAAALQPLEQVSIASAVHGSLPGQMKIRFNRVPRAAGYDVRFAAVPTGGGTPTAWTEQKSTKTSVIIENLTAGTSYAFQVRAFGAAGSTDWSDAVIRMAV